MTDSPRLLAVSRGDPFDPHTQSGVARHLLDALARRYEVVGGVDVSLRPWQRRVSQLTSFRPRREAWRQRFWRSRTGFRLMSRNAEGAIHAVDDSFDLAFQIHGLFSTRGAPYVVECDTTHALNRAGWTGWSPFSDREAERWIRLEGSAYRGARHVFARTSEVARSLIGSYGVPAERVTVSGGGSHYEVRPPRSGPPPVPRALFVGREWGRKGGPDLLAAWPLVRHYVPDAELRIVGPSRAPRPCPPGVQFVGPVRDRKKLSRLYEEASLFCVPSRFEPYGLVFAEAMAFGLPCVATTSFGIPSVVRSGETGLLVTPGDVEALASALVRLLGDPELSRRMGEAGRRRVQRELTWDHVVARMAPVLETLSA